MQKGSSVSRLFESLAAFAFGAGLMHFAYGGAADGQIRIPGHDSFYHVKMAAMLSDHGLLREFPWLRFCYFTREGQAFVSHHYGFHLILWPFVRLAHWLTGDFLPGGQWATIALFGAAVWLFHCLLAHAGTRSRWMWMLLFLFLPFQFFTRHSFIRAISPSLAMILLITWLIFRRRFAWAGLAVAAYVHLYLGGVLFAPIIVGLYAVSLAVGCREERADLPRLLPFTVGGWVLGIVTHPYRGGIYDFLRLQVFGSGLTPDIAVGQEWNPYENLWWFASMSGVLLAVWASALTVRLRSGPTLNAQELALLLLNILFLVLTAKARRFIEYWPPFALLNAAYLASPCLKKWGGRTAGLLDPLSTRRGLWLSLSALLLAVTGVVLIGLFGFGPQLRSALGQPLAHSSVVAVGLSFLALAVFGRRVPNEILLMPTWARTLTTARTFLVALVFLAGATALGARQWSAIRGGTRCQYDLGAVREMMAFLEASSNPGDVIFTDDWDIFPVFFYFNTHNHYIVGLDPKFTHHRRSDLWERYVKVSRGQVPSDVAVTQTGPDGKPTTTWIHARLEDIRDHFGARFVVTDRDHEPLASKLAAARHFTELVYPSGTFAETRAAPFRVFRVREPGEEPSQAPVPGAESRHDSVLYLSAIVPFHVEQGWGDFITDRSVGGGPIYIGGRLYEKGLGTHAPSRIEYRIPDGFRAFEATVGVNQSTGGRGSFVASLYLDGRLVFTSPLLSGSSEPARIHVPLAGARTIGLHAEATDDGNHFDHVDWADARFVASAGTGAPSPR